MGQGLRSLKTQRNPAACPYLLLFVSHCLLTMLWHWYVIASRTILSDSGFIFSFSVYV